MRTVRTQLYTLLSAVKLMVGKCEGAVAATTLDAPINSPVPIPRVGSTAAAVRGLLYLFSGRGGIDMAPIEEEGALWRYDPSKASWELIKPADPAAAYPPGRSYHATATDGNDNVYVHAGCPRDGRLSDFWSFNIESRTWTELEAAPSPPRGGTSIAALKGKIYRMNGFDGKTEQGGALDIYDAKSRTWTAVAFQPDGVHGPSPRSVSALLAVQVGQKDYIVTLFGERDPSSLGHAGAGKMLGDVWAFETQSQQWSKVEPAGDSPAPRGWFDADVLREQSGKDAVIVHGGLAEDNTRLGDVWKLEIA